MNDRVILKEDYIDIREFREKMVYDDTEALVSHVGSAEDERKGTELKSVEIETYGTTTKNSMLKLKDEIKKQFDINNIVIYQRVGKFDPGEKIMAVLISSPDKGEALEALAACLDMFESHVPIKKRVAMVDGREYWVKRADEVMDMYGQVAERI
ncbi:MAG: molybdenum cofactor biosynthesis protein MoaE [Thermoplasmata archaeon]